MKEPIKQQGQRSEVRNQKVKAGGESPESARQRRFPTERLWRIHEALAAGKYPNCGTLAAEFEVSPRTVKRDVGYMRDHFKLPIAYNAERHGFYYAEKDVRFPGAPQVTQAEIFALLVAHKMVAEYQNAPFQKALETGFRKLIGQLDNRQRCTIQDLHAALSFRPLGPDQADVEILEVVTRALQEFRVLRFSYRKPGESRAQQRQVHPYHLACIDNRWYLLAHDVDRGEVRKFVLGRIAEPELSGEHFERPKDFKVAEYLRSGFAAKTGTKDYEVVVEFDAWATDVMRGRRWHWSQEVTEVPGQGSRLRLRVGCLEEVLEWVLRWGMHATVIRPAELAASVGQVGRALAEKYGATEAGLNELKQLNGLNGANVKTVEALKR